MKFGDVKDNLVGKTVSFPIGVDKHRKVVVKRITPLPRGKYQVFYARQISLIVTDETEVSVYE